MRLIQTTKEIVQSAGRGNYNLTILHMNQIIQISLTQTELLKDKISIMYFLIDFFYVLNIRFSSS